MCFVRCPNKSIGWGIYLLHPFQDLFTSTHVHSIVIKREKNIIQRTSMDKIRLIDTKNKILEKVIQEMTKFGDKSDDYLLINKTFWHAKYYFISSEKSKKGDLHTGWRIVQDTLKGHLIIGNTYACQKNTPTFLPITIHIKSFFGFIKQQYTL